MGPIGVNLINNLLTTLFGGEEFDANFQTILGHSIKLGELGKPNLWSSEESAHSTSNSAYGELVGSLLGDTDLNYVGHRACIHGASVGARK